MAVDVGDDAWIGHGGQISWNSRTYSFTSCSAPNITVDSVEKTHSDSASAHREFIDGLVDAGEVSIDLNFPLNLSLPPTKVTATLTITWTNGATFVCSAFLTNITGVAPLDDRMTGTFTWKLTGVPVFTAPS